MGEWLWDLLRRRWSDVPPSAKTLWAISWIASLAFLVLVACGVFDTASRWKESIPIHGSHWFLVSAAVAAFQYFLLCYLGDAARYLSSQPRNIALRRTIRADGLRLLRALHDPSRGYDRILVVGHSLGSAIGYDLITKLWSEFNDQIANPVPHKQPVLHEIPSAGRALSPGDSESLRNFHIAQRDLWREQRAVGNPWKISDFITLGCPLAHAALLLARGTSDFEKRKRQRELPTCPPTTDEKQMYSYHKEPPFEKNGKKFTLSVLHHAAPFAVTKWTNLYFPARLGFFGDFVGGPLQQVLGLGIRDVPVATRRWHGLAGNTLLAHTLYWAKEQGGKTPHPRDPTQPSTPHPLALEALIRALELENLRHFRAPEFPIDAARATLP